MYQTVHYWNVGTEWLSPATTLVVMNAVVPPVRQRDAERTRAELLAVAGRVFAEDGYSGARVDDIAEQTRTTKRMIYYYFGGKEQLYLAVLERAYSVIRGMESDLDVDRLEPTEAVRKLAELTSDDPANTNMKPFCSSAPVPPPPPPPPARPPARRAPPAPRPPDGRPPHPHPPPRPDARSSPPRPPAPRRSVTRTAPPRPDHPTAPNDPAPPSPRPRVPGRPHADPPRPTRGGRRPHARHARRPTSRGHPSPYDPR